jgi:Schlafen, AlbA_2
MANGEGQRIEFKESFAEENAAIKTLCAFAHADGGSVFFGVKDNGEIVGCHVGRNTLENLANKIHRNTDPCLTPAIEKLNINGHVIVAVGVEKVRADQVVFAFGIPHVRVGKTDQIMGPEQIRARLKSDIQIAADVTKYTASVRSTAIGFRKQMVIGRLNYARLELSREDRGFRKFLEKIDTQRVPCPELMSADETKLTQLQCELLSRYRAAERELEIFVFHVLENKANFERKPKNALTGFLHRLKKLDDALNQLIESLETN